MVCIVFFNDTATTEIYALSLRDALPIWAFAAGTPPSRQRCPAGTSGTRRTCPSPAWSRASTRTWPAGRRSRSEEHTSELQSRQYLVCRLLLEKKNTHPRSAIFSSYVFSL